MRKLLIRLLMGVVLIALTCIATGCTALGTTGPISGSYAKTLWGPDVANYQHPNGAAINWSAVRSSGARFAFVKLSEGSSYTNPYGSSDVRAARAAGLNVAGYHFGRPRLPLSTASSDAQRFASEVGNVRQAGFLPPVLDIEANGGLSAANTTAWTHTFLSTLESAIGRTPMIYTGGWFWRGYMGNPGGFSRYPVWMAQYSSSATGPDLFGDWTYSSFWQYTDSAAVSGISGGSDASWFHGSSSQLDSLAYIGPPPPAVQTKPTTKLSIMAASRVDPNTPLWVYGFLTDGRTGATLGGKTFTVLRKQAGQTSFTKVATLKTMSDGKAFYATSQSRTTTYQFQVAAGAAGTGFPGVLSAQQVVTS